MVASFADLSHHQSIVDLAAYARAGHDRVALKATEGLSYVDPTFTARWRQAGQLGLARVVYHFARAANSGAAEFDHFLATVAAGGIGPRDWLCLDAEDITAPARATGHAAEFTNRAAARGISRGLVYTGRWFADPNRLTASVLAPGWRRLWLSDYTPGQPDDQVEIPAGWTRTQLAARQHTDRATVPGVAGGCDYSRVLADWLTSTPDPTPEDDVPLTDAEIEKIAQRTWEKVAVGLSDPTHQYLQDELQPLKDALGQIRTGVAAQADDEAKVLGALASMKLNLTDAQLEQISDHIGIDYDKIAQAARFQISWPGAS